MCRPIALAPHAPCRALHQAAKALARRGRRAEGGGGARRLTLQPIRPKLRLIWHMTGKARRVRLAALLLRMIFLVAQCHFCSDLSVSASATHVCPVLSVASVFPCAISPRASPAL